MDTGAPVSHQTWANAELGRRSEQRLARRGINGPWVGRGRIEESDVVVVLEEGPHDIPANSSVDGQPACNLEIVLNVRCHVEVAQPVFGDKLSERIIGISEKEAGECGARVAGNVRGVGSGLTREGELPAASLAFVVVLIRAANFPANIVSISSVRVEPVVVETEAQFVVLRVGLALTVQTPGSGCFDLAGVPVKVNGGKRDAADNSGEAYSFVIVQLIVDFSHPPCASRHHKVGRKCGWVGPAATRPEPGLGFRTRGFIAERPANI